VHETVFEINAVSHNLERFHLILYFSLDDINSIDSRLPDNLSYISNNLRDVRDGQQVGVDRHQQSAVKPERGRTYMTTTHANDEFLVGASPTLAMMTNMRMYSGGTGGRKQSNGKKELSKADSQKKNFEISSENLIVICVVIMFYLLVHISCVL